MPIHYETAVDHTVVITIDRPEAKNALDLYHFRDLAAAWRRFAEEDDAWVAIITGVGRNFMAGADLKTFIPQITELSKKIGVILYGTDYWDQILNLQPMLEWGAISEEDMNILCRVDTPEAAFEELKAHLLEHHMVPATAQETSAPGIAKTRD